MSETLDTTDEFAIAREIATTALEGVELDVDSARAGDGSVELSPAKVIEVVKAVVEASSDAELPEALAQAGELTGDEMVGGASRILRVKRAKARSQ